MGRGRGKEKKKERKEEKKDTKTQNQSRKGECPKKIDSFWIDRWNDDFFGWFFFEEKENGDTVFRRNFTPLFFPNVELSHAKKIRLLDQEQEKERKRKKEGKKERRKEGRIRERKRKKKERKKKDEDEAENMFTVNTET